MAPGLIAPVVMLMAVFCGSAFVLREDARRRRLNRQLEVATLGVRDGSAAQEQRRSIRRQNLPDEQQRSLIYALLRYDPEASLYWPTSRVAIVGVAAAVVTLLLGRLAFPLWLVLIAAPIAGLLVVRLLFGWQRDRYADQLLRQLPDTIQLVVGAVRAGMPVSEAFRILSPEMEEPTRSEFVRVVDEVALGRPAEEALLDIYRRTHVPEYAIFSVTLSVQLRSGGRLAETIQNLGDTIRERIAIAGKARALAGEPKFSAKVMGASPFVLGIAVSLLHPGFLTPLLEDPRGRTMLVFGATAWACGVLTMRWMIKRGTAV